MKCAWDTAFLPVSSPVLLWEHCGNWKLALEWPQTLAGVSQPEASEHRLWPEPNTDLFFSGRHGFFHSAALNDPGNAFCLLWLGCM